MTTIGRTASLTGITEPGTATGTTTIGTIVSVTVRITGTAGKLRRSVCGGNREVWFSEEHCALSQVHSVEPWRAVLGTHELPEFHPVLDLQRRRSGDRAPPSNRDNPYT